MAEEHLGGFFGNVALLDVASLHPSSIEAMDFFGPYTEKFSQIKGARVAIKHKDFAKAKEIMGDALPDDALQENSKALAQALKIVINSVYGLTSASFPTQFNDAANGKNNRNPDNQVAKRGALFMMLLKKEVLERGYTVVHIKTDSIKIADADKSIVDFVMEFGKKYGYTFELEAVYDKMCIVNKAIYIAHHCYGDDGHDAASNRGWAATGTQFAVPYVFKRLFSHKPIEFEDLCETKSATTSIFLDFNEGLPEGQHNYSFVGKVSAFSPVKPGLGGGELVRQSKEKTPIIPDSDFLTASEWKQKRDEAKAAGLTILSTPENRLAPGHKIEDYPMDYTYSALAGSKGYRWKESSVLRDNGKQDEVDRSYYDELVNGAIETINEYGSYDWLVDEDQPYISPNPASNDFITSLRNKE